MQQTLQQSRLVFSPFCALQALWTHISWHTRLLPWLPEPIKRAGIKGELSQGQEGGGSLPYLWADSRTPTLRYQGCDWHHASSYTLLVFRDTADLTYPPTSCEKNLLQLANVSPSIRDTPTGLQQADLSEAHSWNRQEINWAYQRNCVSQYRGL